MSLSGAMNNALAGLTAAGRATDLIASNISNATTPGYGKRVIELSSTSANFIGGVSVSGVTRVTDPGLISSRRSAQADLGGAQLKQSFFVQHENAIGTPDDPSALTNLLADFEAELVSAAARPDANERLEKTVLSINSVVSSIRNASKNLSDMRSEADSAINAQVDRLNSALQEVESLNTRIAEVSISGQDSSALKDLRQVLIDEVNEMVPLREVSRENGKVALFSEGGVVLVDGPAVELEFTPVHMVTPYMSLGAGSLSGLTVNGRDIDVSVDRGGLRGGTLAANFEIRDTLGPNGLRQIDALARDLVERFQDPAVDPTLVAGDAGLFTDAGLAFNPTDEVGLAERLQINAAVDPSQGGQSWRLRDGLNAAVPGPSGQAAGLNRLADALQIERMPSSGNFGSGSFSISQLADNLMSQLGVERLSADQSLTFASATFGEATQAELASGVDTDQELQNLLLVEKAYAANARILEVVDEMMQTLLRLGR